MGILESGQRSVVNGAPSCYRGVGRGGGVGRDLGVGVGLGVTVDVGVGVGVGEANCAQYLPPVFRLLPKSSCPPQTIISLPVHIAV